MERLSIEKISLILNYILNDNLDGIYTIITDQSFAGKFTGYSTISEYIQDLEDEQRDVMQTNIYKLREGCLDIKDNNISIDNLERLIEHVLLELPRSNQYSKIKSQLDRSEKIIRQFRGQSKKFNEQIEKHEDKMEKMQGEFISILSIFSAIIIAFFGGINLLGSALTNINMSSKYRLICIILIIGLIMFNIIYMLLYTISRLIKRDIINRKREETCEKCDKGLNLKCIIFKYPIMFFFNFITLILILLTTMFYGIDNYNLISLIVCNINVIPDTKEFVGIVSIIIAVILLIPLFVGIKKVMKWVETEQNKCSDIKSENIISIKTRNNYANAFKGIAIDEISYKETEEI